MGAENCLQVGGLSPYPCGMNTLGLMNENAAEKAHIHGLSRRFIYFKS
jgi:hypothetical protein